MMSFVDSIFGVPVQNLHWLYDPFLLNGVIQGFRISVMGIEMVPSKVSSPLRLL
jgi:hypothetical protein